MNLHVNYCMSQSGTVILCEEYTQHELTFEPGQLDRLIELLTYQKKCEDNRRENAEDGKARRSEGAKQAWETRRRRLLSLQEAGKANKGIRLAK